MVTLLHRIPATTSAAGNRGKFILPHLAWCLGHCRYSWLWGHDDNREPSLLVWKERL